MPTYETTVEVSFNARHSVRAADGGMEKTHEHEWRVKAVFRAETLDADGFVIDFLAGRDALGQLAAALTGRDLNKVVPDCEAGASAERLAAYFARSLRRRFGPDVYCVRVAEAPGCGAAFYPDRATP